MLLAAVLAAEDVSFVLVGSAALYLHGQPIPVTDIDAVPAPGASNLARLYAALAAVVPGGRVPSVRSLGTADVVSVRTSYGRLDCLLGRGRRDEVDDRSIGYQVRIGVQLRPGADPAVVRDQIAAIYGISIEEDWAFPAPLASTMRAWVDRYCGEDIATSLTRLEDAIRRDRRRELRNR
jgi:hypothetical protein